MGKKKKYTEQIKENKYYDDWKCKSISEQISKRPYDTLEELEKYIYEYPEDFKGKALYASNLVKVGRLEEASKMLKEAEESYETTHFMSLPEKKRLRAEHYLIMTRLRILLYQEKYEEFLDYWYVYNDIIYAMGKTKEIARAYHYAREQLGKPSLNEREGTSYLYSQIQSYSEERFIERTKNQDYCMDEGHCIFYPEFPVVKAFEEVKKSIMNLEAVRVYSGYIEDLYVFKYDSCGIDMDGKNLDYFSVITFHNTDKYISMSPFPFGLGYKAIDLNYLKEEDIVKTKRKSQIDKFNERYKNY